MVSSPARSLPARFRMVGLIVGLVTTAALTLGAGVVATASAEPLPDPKGLVVHYPFDETSGTVVADASGNGRTHRS